MTSDFTIPGLIILIFLSALGYAVATVGIKLASSQMTVLAAALVCAGFGAAVLAETALLRTSNLAVIYFMIIAFETLMVLGFATMIGDRLSLPQVTGGVMVLAGMVLVANV